MYDIPESTKNSKRLKKIEVYITNTEFILKCKKNSFSKKEGKSQENNFFAFQNKLSIGDINLNFFNLFEFSVLSA